ncbi:hypothetical protein EZS27_018886 [termite gut metagenome]|uniref:Uncharacterized protein n=1 Tax=termite gut metagenome TaxID=433724 RepID=A0A5J4RG62_9ZZZZ
MQSRVSAVNTVITISIHLHIKLFTGLYQLFTVFYGILEMNIIVCRTVNQQ